MPAGGLSTDHQRWIHPRYAFLPARVLSKVFRGKFSDGLKHAFRRGALHFPGTLQAVGTDKAFGAFLRTLFRKNWVVYVKPPFRGPEHLLQYLARLYPACSHLQPPDSRRRQWPSHLPVEGLRPRGQAAEDDALGQRVPAPVPATRAAERLHPHSLFRVPCSATPWRSVAALPSVVGGSSAALSAGNASSIPVALSAMRRSDESHREAARRPVPLEAGLSAELR